MNVNKLSTGSRYELKGISIFSIILAFKGHAPKVHKETPLKCNKNTLLIESWKPGLDTRSQFEENEQ